MNQSLFLGAAIGALAGTVLAIPGIVLESMRRSKQLPFVLDIKEVWGRNLTENEVFLLSVFIHLLFSTAAGLIYVAVAQQGWIFFLGPVFSFPSLLLFSLLAWVVTGTVLYPLLGFGFFARKEGAHIWLEILASNFFLAILLWAGFVFYQPFFFSR